MKSNTAFYVSVTLVFGAALWFVLVQGKGLETSRTSQTGMVVFATEPLPAESHFFSNLQRNVHHPLSILIIQIFCIMIVARILGHWMSKVGQPSVVGEIFAGIALGPSLMGLFFPEFSTFLFPEESLRRLHVLSQIGLVLFMFIIGMELDIGVLKKQAKAAIIISHASIIFPCFLGVALAYFLYASFAPEHIPFSAFALFMGIAMSITAFPVLARIVQERNLTQTPLGTVVITCAAAGDITAWCLLALVVAMVGAGGIISALGSIVLSIMYVLLMWFAVRPLLHRMAIKYDTPESINKTIVAAIFGILLLSSYVTEIIGIHALFGAFLAGVIMPPRKEFKRILSEKIEDVSLVLLLPLFFVFTGLRTQIGLLNQAHLWGVCFLIIGVAVWGKFAGSAVAARFVGQSWKDSLLIGVLMNARGLMELIVLNIGYDFGILSAEIFTMMVLMALVTTFMTGPVINMIEFFFQSKDKEQRTLKTGFNALLSFGSPQSGSRLLELAHYLNLKNEKDAGITALHFSPSADVSVIEAEQYEKEAFLPILQTASRLKISVKRVFGVTDHVAREIVEAAKENPYNVVLVGSSRDLFTRDKTGGKVRNFVHQMDAPVGILIDGGFQKIDHTAVVLGSASDIFLFKYGKRFLEADEKNRLTLMDLSGVSAARKIHGLVVGKNLHLIEGVPNGNQDFYKQFHLLIVSLDFWKNLKRQQHGWLNKMPSILIINK
jgi:Kef-type K+ transport system membrane component KefB